MRYSGDGQAHFHAGQRAHQAEIVEIAQVADPENLAFELRKPHPKRHIEVLQDDRSQFVCVVAGRHHHCGEHGRVLGGIRTQNLQAPRLYRVARGLCMPRLSER